MLLSSRNASQLLPPITNFPKIGNRDSKIIRWEWLCEDSCTNTQPNPLPPKYWCEYDSKSSKEIAKSGDDNGTKCFQLKWREGMPLVLAQEGYEIDFSDGNRFIQRNPRTDKERDIKRSEKEKYPQYKQWIVSLKVSFFFLEVMCLKYQDVKFEKLKEEVSKMINTHN